MAITKIQAGALPADVITTAAIDDASITHAKLHTTMDLSSKTVTLPTLNQSLTLDGPDAGVAKLRLQAEEVHNRGLGEALVAIVLQGRIAGALRKLLLVGAQH